MEQNTPIDQGSRLKAELQQIAINLHSILSYSPHLSTDEAKELFGNNPDEVKAVLQEAYSTLTGAKKKTPAPQPDGGDIGSDIAAAQRQINRLSTALKEGLAKMRAERKAAEQGEGEQNPNTEVEIPKPPVWKDAEEIINRGSLYQKVVLHLNNIDNGRTFNFAALTPEQADTLREDIYSEENFSEAVVYTRTYNAFQQYAKWVEVARISYQKEAAELTGKINLLERMIKETERMKRLAPQWQDHVSKPLHHSTKSNNATITLFPDGEVVLEAVRLKEEIHEQADRTAKELSKLKAFIEPLSDYIYSEGEPPLWPIVPHQLEMWMEYPDAIEEQSEPDKQIYFRFILRKRQEAGETITPEEEELAVYPDYNEVEADEFTLNYAKRLLEDTFYIWEVQKREKAKTKKRGRPRKEK